uniref:Uncharacterized protein n=1 Tax=viral metagenome TaxID=1070528 RepID=A0A6C0BUG8_9ZZZZ
MFHKENLKLNINKLPIIIQKKIYILVWRNFWRNYVPLTAKVPSWYHRKIKIEKIIFQSKLNNIHFLHLPFNTLPENKKWIMGCQCNFCLYYSNENENEKIGHYVKQFCDPSYFQSIMPKSTQSDCNKQYYSDGNIIKFGYDPFCGSYYENDISFALRTNLLQLSFN